MKSSPHETTVNSHDNKADFVILSRARPEAPFLFETGISLGEGPQKGQDWQDHFSRAR